MAGSQGESSAGTGARGSEGGGGVAVRRASAITEARVVATQICEDLRTGEFLDSSFHRRAAALDARDRRWVRELVYGMLRRRAMLDLHLDARIHGGIAHLDPDLIDLLRLGATQLLSMGSVPAYAAIAQTVELAKQRHGVGAGKLVNAVLRRLDRERDSLHQAASEDVIDAMSLEWSHPRWLVERWVARWGTAESIRLLAANNREGPLVARPYHVVREQLEAMLEDAGVEIAEAPLVRDSIVLAGGLSSLTELGAFRQGLFHMQDPASTLVTQYACVATGSVVADLCAAPGGKSIELSRSAAHVLASDVSLTRLQRVLENMRRLEIATISPYVADARYPAIRPVDAVLIDAPCTGTGTFRRHPDARWRLRVSDLAMTTTLQRAILRAAAKVVRKGGLLVYSTCSLEPEENDDQVRDFLAEHPEWSVEAPPEGVVPASVLDNGLLRVLPQRHGTDGSFAARLRRGGGRRVNARAALRGSFPYAIAIIGGFLLAYVVVAFVVFPSGIVPRDAKVPNVTGLQIDDAIRRLAERGFQGKRGEDRFHAASPKGTVLEQDPAAGAHDVEGGMVTLVVSAGQKMATVPTVIGLLREDAESALENAGLEIGTITEQASADPRGQVVASKPSAGELAPVSTPVSLVLSTGANLIAVPDLVGHTVQEAREILTRAGLAMGEVSSGTGVSSDSDKVSSQSPTAGTEVVAGSRVSVQVAGTTAPLERAP